MYDEIHRIYQVAHATKERLDLLHDSMRGHDAVLASRAVNHFDEALEALDVLLYRLGQLQPPPRR